MSVTSIETLATGDALAPMSKRPSQMHAGARPPRISIADRLGLIILLGGLLLAVFGFPPRGGLDR